MPVEIHTRCAVIFSSGMKNLQFPAVKFSFFRQRVLLKLFQKAHFSYHRLIFYRRFPEIIFVIYQVDKA